MGQDSLATEEILKTFRACDALLEGHFVLSSGLHSRVYFQTARVFMDTARAERLARDLAGALPDAVRTRAQCVIAPALGGVLVGHELARALRLPSMFVERDSSRQFQLRRGFSIARGTRVLLAEDIVTTGGSLKEAAELLESLGAQVLACACLIDRRSRTSNAARHVKETKSISAANIGSRLHSLARVEAETFAADALPPDLQSLPPQAPGSRHLGNPNQKDSA